MIYNQKLIQITLGFLLSSLFLAPGLLAQKNEIAFETFGVTEGLPEPWITSVVQDNNGLIWLTTQNGLVKYDGYDFKVYRGDSYKKDNSINELYGNAHDNMILGKDDKLWIGSMWEGFTSLDLKTEQFKNYLYDPKDPDHLPYGPCRIYFEDSRNNIWIVKFLPGYKEPKLMRYNKASGTTSTHPNEFIIKQRNSFKLKSELLESAADSSIWQLNNQGHLKVLNRINDTFENVISSGAIIPGTSAKDTIRLISTGKNRHFLLTGDHGVYVWDAILRKTSKAYTNLTKKDKLLASFKVNYAFEDILGHLWIFQDQGHITLIDLKKDDVKYFVYGEGMLKFNEATTKVDQLIMLDQDHKGIWFGTFSNNSNDEPFAYIYYDFEKKTFEHFSEKFNDKENKFRKGYNFIEDTSLLDHSGLLWIGTRPYLFKQAPKMRQMDLYNHDVTDNYSIPSDTILELFEDSKQRLWLGTIKGIALKTSEGKFKHIFSKKNKFAKELYEDSRGSIWLSAVNNGLYRFMEDEQKFEKIE